MYTQEERLCILFGERLINSKKFFQLIDLYDDVSELLANFDNDKQIKDILGVGYQGICADLKNNYADKIIAEIIKNNVFVVTWYSEGYPNSLRNIDEPPYALFCKGSKALLNKDCLAVVGTRKASSYGRRVATDFTRVLSENFVIVSGLAYGIDTLAHEAALSENGQTIAVLGSGILNIYPSANENLAERIVNGNGLIVSEYGLRELPFPFHFPHRNRIVAGLSRGLLVCQAPQKSGTLSTVELALEQGKDVFVVPGEIYDKGFAGSNNLIKSMQGACVTTPRDIEDYYDIDTVKVKKQVVQLTFDEQKIVNSLLVGTKSFDQLIIETQLTPSELNFLLANLELRSIIARLSGNLYRLYGGIE